MPKAIFTKFLGPTDHKGSRYKAYDLDGNQVTIGKDYERDTDENHQRAAEALATKMGWKGEWIGGHGPRYGEMTFVNVRINWSPRFKIPAD